MSTGSPVRLGEAVERVLPETLEVSRRVHPTPEIAYRERQASAWTAELMARSRRRRSG